MGFNGQQKPFGMGASSLFFLFCIIFWYNIFRLKHAARVTPVPRLASPHAFQHIFVVFTGGGTKLLAGARAENGFKSPGKTIKKLHRSQANSLAD